MENITAMILAGGRGKRMDIFCNQRPKPILPFAGQFHVIDLTLSNCVHSQINNIAVLIDYQRETMAEYLNQWKGSNPGIDGLAVFSAGPVSYTGTANAVYQNLDYLRKQDSDIVLVLAGDHIYTMDYRKMVSFHLESQADVTVGVVRVPFGEAHRFGTVNIGPGGRIIKFVEKSPAPASNLASMGIYVFNRRYLIERLMEDARNTDSLHDFGYSILPQAVNRDRVFGNEFKGYWRDIGTVESYYEANLQLLREKPDFRMEDSWPIYTVKHNLSSFNVDIPQNVVNSLISPGCIIEGYVENSVLSPGVWVAKKARILNSVVMANTHIGYHSVVDQCILDEEVNIDKFCYLGFGTSPLFRTGDITMVGKQVNLGPQIAIGKKSKIMPGLKLDDLASRFVPPGTIVSVPA
jgi:glucose-1-phosphate adenylyltransferase